MDFELEALKSRKMVVEHELEQLQEALDNIPVSTYLGRLGIISLIRACKKDLHKLDQEINRLNNK